jgi:hypothetical protein
VQIGAVLLCKGGIREYRVWSIEYRARRSREEASWDGDMGTSERTRGHEDRRARGPERAGSWFLRPRAERLTPERLTTVAVTRHLECVSFRMRCHRIPTSRRLGDFPA